MLNGQNRKIEVDKEEADEIIAINTFKEIKGMKIALGNLATAISQPKEDKAVADALKEAAKGSQAVADAIKAIPKPETPDVNIQFDHEKFVTSMDKIADRIEKAIDKGVEAQKNKLMVDEFIISAHGYNGQDRTAKVVYKPMKDIIIKK